MHAENKDEMRDKILEAALKRFTQYSASKTTMNEIADDLHCSKASLYYYFPDKKGLHHAVMEKIGEALFNQIQAEAAEILSAEAALMRIIEVRYEFVQRFCRLEIFKILNDNSEETLKAIKRFKERDDALIAEIFQRSVDNGECVADDAAAVAELFNQALAGLRFSVLDCSVRRDLETEEFEKIVAQQRLLSRIFIRGLKHR